MANIFFTSDHHFNHNNIIRYCDRPYQNVEEMNEDLIKRWNSAVTCNDIVYYLGDFGFGGTPKIHSVIGRLNRFRMIMIRGNHDPTAKHLMNWGFDEVYKYKDLELYGRRLFLSHIPVIEYEYDAYLCGHVHNNFRIKGNIMNVGVDVNNYAPINWDEIPWEQLRNHSIQIKETYYGSKDGPTTT